MQYLFLGCLVAAIATVPAAADEPVIVVTATGIAQDRDASGQAISVIDAAAIARSQATGLADLLWQSPSVRVNRNGSFGSVTSLSLRGAEIGQTLVLVDGVRVNDPGSTSDAADFGNLLVGNVARVEVMRGSNAVAWGSEAIGGVIDVTTRDPAAPDGLSARGRIEGGYAGTVQGAADLAWRAGEARVDAGIAALHSDGISSAAARFGATERDGVDNWTAHAGLLLPLASGVALDLRGYGISSRLDYDSFFGAPADSADESRFRQGTGYAGLAVDRFGVDSRLSLTLLANARDYRFAPGTPADFGYRGRSWRLEYRGKVRLAAGADALVGLSHDAPQYRFFGFGSDERHGANTDSGFAMLLLRPAERLSLTAGVRHDVHSQFGGVTTLGANANYGLGANTRLRAAFGQGFRAPSLYQLYDSYAGNAALAPERSESFDLGLDHRLGPIGTVALTAFSRSTREQIDYDNGTGRYFNLARTRARGIEAELALHPGAGLELQLAYSLVDTRDRSPGSPRNGGHLDRRPVHGLTLAADRVWPGGLATGATLRLASAAVDRTAPSGRLAGYALVDLRASLPVGRQAELFARVENATDRRYETAWGYSTSGRAAYAGVRLGL